MKLLYVEWFDACSPELPSWYDREDAIREVVRKSDDLCVSVGFLIFEDEHRIVIASSLSAKTAEDYEVDGILCVPRGMIRVLKELSV